MCLNVNTLPRVPLTIYLLRAILISPSGKGFEGLFFDRKGSS